MQFIIQRIANEQHAIDQAINDDAFRTRICAAYLHRSARPRAAQLFRTAML